METVKLSHRLEAVYRLVPPGQPLADVGTDHGYLPVRLLQDGVIQSAVASDIRPGPLSAAKNNAEKAGVKNIRFCLCSGLEGVSPHEVDTVVIAGMGGETISAILENAPWVRNGKTLILQPMTKPEILRKTLDRMELRIEQERLAEDGGRIYPVLLARAGMPEKHNEAEYYTGRYALISREELFRPFLTRWENKFEMALAGLSKTESERRAHREEHLRTVCRQLREMREIYDKGI